MATDAADVLYRQRLQRFEDAVALRQPDRVPMASLASFFMTRLAGISPGQALYDYEAMAAAWRASAQRLGWDLAPPTFTMLPGPLLDALGARLVRWPGGSLPAHLPYQFVEAEYMSADEYPSLVRAPDDFLLRTVLPRWAQALTPLAAWPTARWGRLVRPVRLLGLPPRALWGALGGVALRLTGNPPQWRRAWAEALRWQAAQSRLAKALTASGFPLVARAFTLTPYDFVASFLRGLRGISLDMHRRPQELLAALEILRRPLTEAAIALARRSGVPRVFLPLHRGAASFMSTAQFARFYWPHLRGMLLDLVAAGLTPLPFFEGDYTARLPFLAELPPGKVLGHFDQVDLPVARRVLGGRVCFWGNVPASLLVAGAPAEVQAYVRRLIDTFGDSGLVVDGAVDGLPAESRPENVAAITEAVWAYGRRR
ncbi:MAG: hypothetical protein GX605_03595 [Chloroflexi bacterium]|nr:hypothetical protein [Chloroflexota bacterium]